MGFSVSGAAAIIFVGLFIAFGTWYTASANSFEQVTEAQQDRTDTVLETQNSHVEIASAEHNPNGNGNLVVIVTNSGATQLSVADTDLLADGEYVTGWADDAIVDGPNPDSDLWLAGDQLNITVSRSAPERVKVVAATGVADTSEVTVVT
jgi:flagellar protein FlaF